MQVATLDHGSSATLGAVAAPQAVSITGDMSLIMMLTTNLYSNQMLAAIREPLCNAWDANIEAGTTDQPLVIKITKDGNLMIQDSGLGIPAEKMKDVYGVYGQSTKKDNDAVTGGFGLGSKAPWALADSFRVISECGGIKTIYNMPKSCVENDGLPGILPVATMPTERSGLTLLIPIPEDKMAEAVDYVKAIVCHGAMNATFENEIIGEGPYPMPVLEMSDEPGSYNVDSTSWWRGYMGDHSIFVRYGAVIYPMLRNPKTDKVANVLEDFMGMVGFRRMVVQAAPGSLALTPSREALSSHKMTEDGLVDLLTALVKRIEEDLIKQIPDSIKHAIHKLETGNYMEFGSETTLTSRHDGACAIQPHAVRKYLRSKLGSGFLAKYQRFLYHAENRGFKLKYQFENQSATKRYHKLRLMFIDNYKRRANRREILLQFFNHYVMRPMGKVFTTNPDMHPSNLRLSFQNYWNDRRVTKDDFCHSMGNGEDFKRLQQMVDKKVYVFITTRLAGVAKSINDCPNIGHTDLAWVYRVDPKKRKEISNYVKAFEDAGYSVVDLSQNHSWDSVAQEALLAARTKPKKVKEDKPQIKNMLATLVNFYTPRRKRKMELSEIATAENLTYVTDSPLFYVELDEFRKDTLGRFVHILDLTDEEMQFGVVVRNGIERRMAENRGAVSVDNYFAPKLIAKLKTKAYARYVTKQRQPSISEEFDVTSSDLKLFRTLGITLPGLDKLKFIPELERARERARSYPGTLLATIDDPAEQDAVQAILNLQFEAPAFVKKLAILKDDPMLRQLNMRNNSLLDWIDQYPERIPALKSLVLSVLKKRK
jgi:hypothetical protein